MSNTFSTHSTENYGRRWARISLSRGSVLSREYFPSSSFMGYISALTYYLLLLPVRRDFCHRRAAIGGGIVSPPSGRYLVTDVPWSVSLLITTMSCGWAERTMHYMWAQMLQWERHWGGAFSRRYCQYLSRSTKTNFVTTGPT